jgi:hypothetical protein
MNTAKERYEETKKHSEKNERQEVENAIWMRTEGQREKL